MQPESRHVHMSNGGSGMKRRREYSAAWQHAQG
jgi:hypothetical protein